MTFPVQQAIYFFQNASMAAEKVYPSDFSVVLTGISLVFIILILLTLVLVFSGKFFAALGKNKKTKAQNELTSPPVAVQAPVLAPALAIQDGIPPEVVAAISAAVASIEGGKYTLASVAVSPKGRGQWGLAGVISNTEPF